MGSAGMGWHGTSVKGRPGETCRGGARLVGLGPGRKGWLRRVGAGSARGGLAGCGGTRRGLSVGARTDPDWRDRAGGVGAGKVRRDSDGPVGTGLARRALTWNWQGESWDVDMGVSSRIARPGRAGQRGVVTWHRNSQSGTGDGSSRPTGSQLWMSHLPYPCERRAPMPFSWTLCHTSIQYSGLMRSRITRMSKTMDGRSTYSWYESVERGPCGPMTWPTIISTPSGSVRPNHNSSGLTK